MWKSQRRIAVVLGTVLVMGGLSKGVPAKASKATARREGKAAAAGGGELAGKVYFKGSKPKLPAIDMMSDSVCASEQSGSVFVQDGEVNNNGALPNAFVYIKSGTGNLSVPTPHNSVVLTQQACMYEPHVLGIMVGQPLQVVTVDPTTHNVHVMPRINREWNVTQQPGSASIIKTFARTEMAIPVHCNVHPWMTAYINVVSNPFFAVTGNDGSFAIRNVPAGQYTVEIWTATFGTQEQHVTVRAGETSTFNPTFEAH